MKSSAINPALFLKNAAVALVLVATFIAMDNATIALQILPDISAWYPPAALTLAALLAIGLWYMPILCVAAWLCLPINYHQHASFWNVASIVSGVGAYTLGAWLLRDGLRLDLRFRRLRDVLLFTLVTLPAAVGAAAGGVSMAVVNGDVTWQFYRRAVFTWSVGDAAAFVSITPFLLLFVFPSLRKFLGKEADVEGSNVVVRAGKPTRRWYLEVFVQVVSVPLALWVAFGFASGRSLYVCFIPVIWIAVRHGLRGTAIALLAINTGAVAAFHFLHPATASLTDLQCYMLALAVTGLLLGALIEERKVGENALREAEATYRALFEDSADATFLMDEKGFLACNSAALELFGYSNVDRMRHPADISPPNQPDGTLSLTAAEQRISAAFLKGKERYDWLHQRKDGSVFPAEVYLTALTLTDGPRVLATVRDITQRRRTEETLVQEHSLLRTLIDNMPDYIYAKDTNNRFLLVNEALALRMGAASSDELVGKSDFDFYPPDLAAKYVEDEQQIMHSGQPVIDREESTIDATNGRTVWHTTTEVPLEDQNGSVMGLLGIGHIITERKRAEEALRDSEETNRVTFEQAPVGIAHAAPDGGYLRVNDKLCAIVGYSREELLKMTFQDITHPDDLSADLDHTRQLLAGEIKTYSSEKRYIRKDRSIFWSKLTVSLVRSASGEPQFFIYIVEEITDRKRAEERVQFLAYYDALTELPNRTLLQDRLVTAFAGARRRKEKVALLFLDVDRFKTINDSFGHAVGDRLLQSVAQRIKGWAREQDTVARWGGDEFLIVLTGIKDIADAAVAAERLMKAMTTEFVVQGHSLSIACSIGISVFPDHGTDAETLVKHADAAMYCAKESGGNNFQFFTEDMNAQAVERLTLEQSLRKALERKELFLAYQPQMDIATGRLTGLEALLRWQHPEMGLVLPDKFIRIAENSGLIVPIGEWVLRTACAQVRKWHDEGLLAVPVAVNVSAIQFRQEGFCQRIRKILQETCLAPHHLELELTESLLLSSADAMLSVLRELKDMGLKLAIDDFGTGYSSLSYLRQFPVSKLKIDRSFIKNVTVNPNDAAIAATIISMAKSLHLTVIAEGVETEEQMSFLQAHQCDEIQGYYFCKPLPADELADKLQGRGLSLKKWKLLKTQNPIH